MPARQAPAAPRAFARAAAVLTLAAGHPGVATIFVLCFYGLLRVSEPLQLLGRDIVLVDDQVILLLGRTKRGMLQR
eukprot:3833910-Lingulodinium_polyedra.AAC.1